MMAALSGLVLERARAVEDGQFEREYSRLYTMIVGGAGALIVLALVTLLIVVLRKARQRS
jgi:hypothetical protein